MGDSGLYDTDILIWSDQQAAALRGLVARRDLPNELDLANVIEEIEDVGRREINAATSYVRLILGQVVKGWADPRSRAMRHWGGRSRQLAQRASAAHDPKHARQDRHGPDVEACTATGRS